MKMKTLGLAGLLLMLAAPTQAAEKITTTLNDEGTGDGATHGVYFSGSCGEECLMAGLTCNGSGSLEVQMIDIPAKEAAKSILRDNSVLVMTIGGTRHDMSVSRFSFSEMNGSWDVDATAGDPDAVYKGLADAKSFKLSLEKQSATLPVTSDVKAWAKSCLK